jgi:hypothetical protein
MPDFKMSKYLPTLISIRYPSILDNKLEQLFSSEIYPNKVTSSKVHSNSLSYCSSSFEKAALALINSIKLEGELQLTLRSLG